MRDPINPADIRVGDRVERVQRYVGGDETVHRLRVTKFDGQLVSGDTMFFYAGAAPADSVEWFLLDRPDPLAEVVEVVARAQWEADNHSRKWADATADQTKAYRFYVRRVVAAIAERWELVERGKS